MLQPRQFMRLLRLYASQLPFTVYRMPYFRSSGKRPSDQGLVHFHGFIAHLLRRSNHDAVAEGIEPSLLPYQIISYTAGSEWYRLSCLNHHCDVTGLCEYYRLRYILWKIIGLYPLILDRCQSFPVHVEHTVVSENGILTILLAYRQSTLSSHSYYQVRWLFSKLALLIGIVSTARVNLVVRIGL